MDFELSPELAELQATVRRIAQDKVAPRAREIDVSEEYPQDLFELFVETGLTGLCIPEAYGGSGAGILGLAIAIEEISKYSNAAALMLLLTRLPTGSLLIAGSEEQKHKYLTPLAAGEQRAAFGLSEPQAGSDVMGMRTRAVRDGDDWLLTGTKCWMCGVVQADWYCVFAKTGPGRLARPRQHQRVRRRARLGRRLGRSDRQEDGREGRRHRRAAPRRRVRARRERRRRDRRVPALHARPQRDAPDRRGARASGSPRAR